MLVVRIPLEIPIETHKLWFYLNCLERLKPVQELCG